MRIYASKIPDEIIRNLLLSNDNPIENAIPVSGNENMELLADVWYEFIEPNSPKDTKCPICLNNILSSFKNLYPVLVELEREYELLKYIKMKADKVLKRATRALNKAIVKGIKAGGHTLTGALEGSVQDIISDNKAKGYMNDYGFIVNDGVKPSRIPYGSGESKSGGKSKYIENLIDYFKKRGFGEKKAESLAFATAKVQKKEGMSTKASSRFSKKGKRQGFLEDALKKAKPSVDEIMRKGMTELFLQEFRKRKSERL